MRRYTIKVNDTEKVIDVEAVGANLFRVKVDGRRVDVELTDHRDLGHGTITPAVQLRASQAPVPQVGPPPTEHEASAAPAASAPPTPAAPAASGGGGRDKMTAPMPGVILSIGVAPGAAVKRGDALMVLEAMKMKNELKSTRDGVVAEIYVSAGQQVKFGEFLVRFEA